MIYFPRKIKKMYRSIAKNPIFIIVLFIVLGVVIYSPALKGPFVFDDIPNIKLNPSVHMEELGTQAFWDAALKSPARNRIVSNLSFAFNYYFVGLDSTKFRIVNIIIHIAAGFFLFVLIKETLNTPSLAVTYSKKWTMPLIASLLWFVHPIQTQSVAYIVQRMNSLSAMFYILSLLGFAKGRIAKGKYLKSIWFFMSIAAGVLALCSKEIAATLPLLIFLYEWYFFRDAKGDFIKKHMSHFIMVVFMLIFISVLYFRGNPIGVLESGYEYRGFSVFDRIFTELRVVAYYVCLLLFPHPSRLNLDHNFILSKSLFNPITTLISLFFILASILWALRIRKKFQLISFCIIAYFINLAIESSIIPLEIIFEHRNYLPSMFLLLGIVALVEKYLSSLNVKVGLVAVVCIVLSRWTYQRSFVWGNEVVLWRDCVVKSANKARPNHNLGLALEKEGKTMEAVEFYSAALRIEPNFPKAHHDLGVALGRLGKLADAVGHFQKAIEIDPEYSDSYYNLGLARMQTGALGEAEKNYLNAIKINPNHLLARFAMGDLFERQGRLKEAANVYYDLGTIFYLSGRSDEASQNFRKAVKMNSSLKGRLNFAPNEP